MKRPEDEQDTPRHIVIVRAVAPWPDTTSCEVQMAWIGDEPTPDELAGMENAAADMFRHGINGVEPERVKAVVLPYASQDEDPE